MIQVGVSNIIATSGPEPVSLDRVKQQLRIDSDLTHDDEFIEHLIQSARSAVETQLKLPLMRHTIRTVYADFSDELPLLWPTDSITSLEYVDKDGLSETVSADDYYLSGPNVDLIKFIDTYDFPKYVRSVTVEYVCKKKQITPPDIVSAMLLTITDLYENRTNPARRYMTASDSFINRHRVPTI